MLLSFTTYDLNRLIAVSPQVWRRFPYAILGHQYTHCQGGAQLPLESMNETMSRRNTIYQK